MLQKPLVLVLQRPQVPEPQKLHLLPPLLLLDGFGRPGAPDARTIAVPLRADQDFEPSPRSPPGLYGDSREFAAFNLGDSGRSAFVVDAKGRIAGAFWKVSPKDTVPKVRRVLEGL